MTRRTGGILFVTLAAISLLGTTVLGISTRWGTGLSPDSVVYISAARALLSGNGFSVPSYYGPFVSVVQHPPLYSACLAAFGLAGLDPLEGAMWLNLLLFAANVTLAGLAVHIISDSLGASALISLLAALSFPMVQIHSMAWSEPLFIFCTLLGLVLLACHIEARRHLVLIASSVLLGLGFLTRYAGAATVFTGLTGIFVLSKTPWRQRFADATVLTLLSCSLVGVWMVRNLFAAGSATGRGVGFHPPSLEHLKSAMATVSSWLLPVGPSRDGASLVAAATLTIAVILIVGRRKELRTLQGQTRLPILLLFFVINYGLLLFITVSFLDVQTPLDNRILSPSYLGVLVLAVCLSVDLWRVPKAAALARISLAVVLFVFLLSHLERSARWLEQSYDGGLGYASAMWKESKILRRIHALDSRTLILTNGPDALYVLAGRSAIMIPSKVDPRTRIVNENYNEDLAKIAGELSRKGGTLVYFYTIPWRWYLPSEEELRMELALRLLVKEEDGSIYQLMSDTGKPSSK